MINLNPAATTAAPSTLGGVPAAAGGDFLAMLAGIVGSVTSAAGPDGDGVLLPGSPLLATDGEVAGDLADLAAELGSLLDVEVGADGEPLEGDDDAADAAFLWPTVQALAAMLAQPATAPPAEAAVDADGEAIAVQAPTTTDATVAGTIDAAVETAVDLAEQLTAMSAPATGDTADVTGKAPAAASAASAAGTAAEAASSTDRAAAAARASAPIATTAAADGADATSVLDAAADADAGEPQRVEAPRGPATEFRPARSGAADTLAEQVQATGELRDSAASVRDRGPMTSTAAGVARVLDALEMLEKAPPPRQVTLELGGDIRVRVAVEDGAVRMQLLGEQRDGGRDFLRAANDALRERGFEMAGDSDARDRDADQQRPDLAPRRPERGFGRAGRSTDPSPSGVRAGIHL